MLKVFLKFGSYYSKLYICSVQLKQIKQKAMNYNMLNSLQLSDIARSKNIVLPANASKLVIINLLEK